VIPDLMGTLLATGSKTSLHQMLQSSPSRNQLVMFKFRDHAETHLKSFRDPFFKHFGGRKGDIGTLDVVVAENPYIRFLSGMIERNMRKIVSVDRQSETLMHFGPITDVRARLDMKNGLLGWVFLVDRDMRVRWGAHGVATPDEVSALTKSIDMLLGETETVKQTASAS
jgi:ATPase complex subunit ATP10